MPPPFPNSQRTSTLLQGLSFQGGSDLNGASEILLRASIAAVLNAPSASAPTVYPLTKSQVISQTNNALSSKSRGTILNLATTLDNYNNGSCRAATVQRPAGLAVSKTASLAGSVVSGVITIKNLSSNPGGAVTITGIADWLEVSYPAALANRTNGIAGPGNYEDDGGDCERPDDDRDGRGVGPGDRDSGKGSSSGDSRTGSSQSSPGAYSTQSGNGSSDKDRENEGKEKKGDGGSGSLVCGCTSGDSSRGSGGHESDRESEKSSSFSGSSTGTASLASGTRTGDGKEGRSGGSNRDDDKGNREKYLGNDDGEGSYGNACDCASASGPKIWNKVADVPVSGWPAVIQPGQTLTLPYSFTLTAAYPGSLGMRNVVKVTVTGAEKTTYQAHSSSFCLPRLSLTKYINGVDANSAPGPIVKVGSPVNWTYAVTNTGNVKLTGVTVTDDQGVTVTCPKTTLNPGDSMTCTAGGTARAGQYTNIGKVIGTPPGELPRVSATDPANYFGDGTPPAITVTGVESGRCYSTTVVPVISVFDLNLDPTGTVITLDGVPYNSGTPVTAEGIHTLFVSATDMAGNPATQTMVFTIDLTPPVVTDQTNNGGEHQLWTSLTVNGDPATATTSTGVYHVWGYVTDTLSIKSIAFTIYGPFPRNAPPGPDVTNNGLGVVAYTKVITPAITIRPDGTAYAEYNLTDSVVLQRKMNYYYRVTAFDCPGNLGFFCPVIEVP